MTETIRGLTLASIDLMAPHHHWRLSSCSDENPCNGHRPGTNSLPKCTRCALLIALRDGKMPAGLCLDVAFKGIGE